MFKLDKNGQLNIEFLFCSILLTLILITFIPYLTQNITTNQNIEENLEGRLLLNQISEELNQINSNSYGFSKYIKLPETVGKYNYILTIKKNEVILEYNDKKGNIKINPINLIDQNNESLNEKRLFNGGNYKITKKLLNSNETVINQSSIMIQRIKDW